MRRLLKFVQDTYPKVSSEETELGTETGGFLSLFTTTFSSISARLKMLQDYK